MGKPTEKFCQISTCGNEAVVNVRVWRPLSEIDEEQVDSDEKSLCSQCFEAYNIGAKSGKRYHVPILARIKDFLEGAIEIEAITIQEMVELIDSYIRDSELEEDGR